MSYSLKLKAFLSLIFLTLILSCQSPDRTLTPEETFTAYVELIVEGKLKEASLLRYDPLLEWDVMKKVLGGVLLIGTISVVIRLTGLNPFTALLHCYLIENHVSPSNRKYVLAGIFILILLTSYGLYWKLSDILIRIPLEIDAHIIGKPLEVKVLDASFKGKRSFVDYELVYENTKRRGRAELVFQRGGWRIRKL